MFMGLSSIGRVGSYDDALAMHDKATRTPTGKQRFAQSYGYPLGTQGKTGVRMVRKTAGGDVILRLYETDCVTWHPDNSFTIGSWASKTTGEFISALTPVRVNASCDITYHTTPYSDWRDYWKHARVCHGDVTFRPMGDGLWAPDEATCTPFTDVRVDATKTRAIAKAHNLTDFEMWLSMAPRHLPLEHERADMGIVAEALLERNWRKAAAHLPLVYNERAYGRYPVPLDIVTGGSRIVTMGSVKRFRLWLYDAEGATHKTRHLTMSSAEYEAARKRIRQLELAGVYVASGWGW